MIPIVMTAFGTTADALATYAAIEDRVRTAFPDDEVIRAYSSRTVTRVLQSRTEPAPLHLAEVLEQLNDRGESQAVVQSLHLFPGVEFHRLHETVKGSGLRHAIGNPLFTDPEDYERLGEILRPILGDRPEQAILLLGHGTDHPAWTAYYTLEKILRRRFGERLFVGVVEKSPDSRHLVDEIAGHGFVEAIVIPLFLVNGLHFRRDIMGIGNDDGWLTRLGRKNIAVDCLQHGLGLLPGLADLVVDHIALARHRLLQEQGRR